MPFGDIQISSREFAVALLILALTFIVQLLLAQIIRRYFKSRHARVKSSILLNVARISVWAIGGLSLLQYLGIEIGPILTAAGIGGVALALGLQDTLSNLFSGLQVIATQSIRIGHYVTLSSGQEGMVHDITWRNTILRDPLNNLLIIPNSTMAEAIVTNHSLPQKREKVLIELRVAYDNNLSEVEQVCHRVARKIVTTIEGVDETFEPVIRFSEVDTFRVHLTALFRVKEWDAQFVVRHEFIKQAHAALQKKGVKLTP